MNPDQILPIMLAAAPTMLTVLIGILVNNARLSDLKSDVNSLRSDMNARIGELRVDMNTRFNEMDRRFDDVKDLWRSELHRVEEVLDARLKHLEER
jgi:hypothetical protein